MEKQNRMQQISYCKIFKITRTTTTIGILRQQWYCAESNQQWSQQSLRKRKLTWKHNNQSDTGANIIAQKHRRVTHSCDTSNTMTRL